MAPSRTTITLTPGSTQGVESVVAILAKRKGDDYYVYERKGHWHLGIGVHSSLLIDPKGETATVVTESKEQQYPINKPLVSIVHEFVSVNVKQGSRIHGQAGFNYAAHIRGLEYSPGHWPLLSMMVPRIEITIHQEYITVTGFNNEEVKELCSLMVDEPSIKPTSPQVIDTQSGGKDYTYRVSQALAEISEDKYTKVILSRAVDIQERVEMPATLLQGRRSNNPARSFSFSHGGLQATGFSPELVLSVHDRKVTTEPLAGTRSCKGTEAEAEKLRHELLNDPKEIVEHVISVKEAIGELNQLCLSDTIAVEGLMEVRRRGSVQHLGSRVVGMLSPERSVWEAFEVLFPSITASGIPKRAAIEAIQRLEHQPRELYAGAVFMIEDLESFEAALVLRTVFQDENRQWVQAGAGVISQSLPEREMTETCEKLASIAPFVVTEPAT
ncbi:ADC synthase [Aspergillus avenaceus]|uniref:ADC synthase n=1 Tax=Aspergillus avenaceus TaxID=36643 RepID=A0A5N6U1T3_ASPAV|nr:ADC synthase [Aspergillus avenaceus]